jgi:hypothetical protein
LFRNIPELKLRDVENWEQPYEEDEITIEQKQEILKRIEDNLVSRGWRKKELNFDFSMTTAFFTYKDIFDELKGYANMNSGNSNKYSIVFDIAAVQRNSYRYCKLSSDNKKLFKSLLLKDKNTKEGVEKKYVDGIGWVVSDNYKLENYLIGLAEWVISQKGENSKQEIFDCGLCALDIVYIEDNHRKIKEILNKYIKVVKNEIFTFYYFLRKESMIKQLIISNN